MFSFTSSLPAGLKLKVNIMQVESNQDGDTTPGHIWRRTQPGQKLSGPISSDLSNRELT